MAHPLPVDPVNANEKADSAPTTSAADAVPCTPAVVVDWHARRQALASIYTTFFSLLQDKSEEACLVALNATIEATRAAEAASGFAVAAKEVQALSEAFANGSEAESSDYSSETVNKAVDCFPSAQPEKTSVYTGIENDSLPQRIAAFLKEAGLPNSDSTKRALLQTFPELEACAELKTQFHTRQLERAPAMFRGIRPDGEPVEFLDTHYREAIEQGRVWPTVIKKLDAPLYQALCDRARRSGVRVSDYLDNSRVGFHARRRELLRTIIDAGEEDIASFYEAARDQRQKNRKT